MSEKFLSLGVKLVSGGTDNHLMLLKLLGTGITGKELEHRLDEVGITLNKNSIPNDPEKPFVTSGVRIGTPAATSRGFVETDMAEIARLIHLTATQFDSKKDYIRDCVTALCDKYPLY